MGSSVNGITVGAPMGTLNPTTMFTIFKSTYKPGVRNIVTGVGTPGGTVHMSTPTTGHVLPGSHLGVERHKNHSGGSGAVNTAHTITTSITRGSLNRTTCAR